MTDEKASPPHAEGSAEASEPTPAPAATARSSKALIWVLLALLLALCAAGVAGYNWYTLRALAAERDQTRAAVEEARTALATTSGALNTISTEFGQLRSAMERTEGTQRGFTRRVDRLEGEIADAGRESQRLAEAIAALRGLSETARERWIRAETEYYLQAGNTWLQVARDPRAALAAFSAADERLGELSDPGLTKVRRALADEIAALRAVPRTDVEGIALSLGSLAARIEMLPLAHGQPTRFDDDAERAATGETAWARARSAVGGALKGLVSIQREDAAIAPLLAPEERFFLYRNLQLQLETARLAALKRDSANYRESLRSARHMLETHFALEDTGVTSTLETLAELEGREIDPPLPEVSDSLRLLRRAASEESDD